MSKVPLLQPFAIAQVSFLDEIGDMSLAAQAKVLRALQESLIQRVGADKDIKVNVRVVAATNKDLKKEIEEGRFREDLYHRLAVILIKVPALNERRDDIPLLIEHFTQSIAADQGTSPKTFSEAAIQLLQEYDWTGNIRELRNVVERLIILGGNEISETDVKLFASK
jgi:two-component system nitrogen regulation response regulator NtrX